jgi:hypothetical protein
LFFFLPGEQDSEVSRFYVEPFVMGDGGSSGDGIDLSKRRCKLQYQLSWSFSSTGLLKSYTALYWKQVQGPDWEDFLGIVCLLIINSTISFIEENNAGNAAAALMACLALKTKVCMNRTRV